MKSILDIQVSAYKDYNTPNDPMPVTLLNWLTSKKYAEKVDSIRATSEKSIRDELKATLPAITPHGSFAYRSNKNLLQHSGFMQFDIDFKDNAHITNYRDLKMELCKLVNVAYCGLSVSGTGFWGLIPIVYPDKHRQHFDYIYDAFKAMGIVIDKKPRNVAALRGYSYDADGYFNHYAKRLEQYLIPPPPKQVNYNSSGNSTQSQVEALITIINSKTIDIAPNYDEWLSIGFSLANEFGERGRQYYNAISQFYTGIRTISANDQYTKCLKGDGSGITIKTFFFLCKVAGIELPKHEKKLSKTTGKQPSFEKLKNGVLIELTPNSYPASWDCKSA